MQSRGGLPIRVQKAKNMTKEERRKATAASVAQMIRDARAKRGWSLYRLAKESGLSVGHVVRIERGDVAVRVDVLHDIVQALGVRIVIE